MAIKYNQSMSVSGYQSSIREADYLEYYGIKNVL